MARHTSWSCQPEHSNKMQWCFVFAAVVAVVSGQRVIYDGTHFPNHHSGFPVISPPQPAASSHHGPAPHNGFPGRYDGTHFDSHHGTHFSSHQSGFPVISPPQPAVSSHHGPAPHNGFPGRYDGTHFDSHHGTHFSGHQSGFPVISPPQPAVSPAVVQDPLPCSYGAGTLVHETSQGRREYHFSWCHRPGQTFSHAQADHYCRSLPYDGHPVGFHAVTIEDHAEDAFISTIISAYRVPFIWTSGKKVSEYAWKWQNGATVFYTNWSYTGRFGRAQPDNAAGDEDCLAVLNNIYSDGITWHDSSCHNNKYVICERPKAYGSH